MEDDKLALERILVLIRNVLMVAADPGEERRTDDENSMHDRVSELVGGSID
jgi:timeless